MVGDILQPTHLLFILVVALLVLGPKRLPEVGRTLGTGLRDFKAAINGESHEDHTPRAYVEPEPEPVAPHDADAAATEPPGFNLSTEDPVASNGLEDQPAAPTTLHEHQVDPPTIGDDLHAPEATEELHPPATDDDLQQIDDLHPPTAVNDLSDHIVAPEPEPEPEPESALVAVASSNGFASALASSRQRPAADGEPAADDQ